MAHEAEAKQLQLPTLVFGVAEVRRLQRELDSLDELLQAARLRGGGRQGPLPRLSRLLEALAEENNKQLLKEEDRQELLEFLANIEKTAPWVHMSFASDPSSAFLAKVTSWLRSNIHPHALLRVGLQPTIAAGCVLRTANKTFDFSLRNRFIERRGMLVGAMDKQEIQAQEPRT